MAFEIELSNVIFHELHVEWMWKITHKPNIDFMWKVVILLKLVRGKYTTGPSRNQEGQRFCDRVP